MNRFDRRFRKIARSLSQVELMEGSMDELFDPEEAFRDRTHARRFLDFYGDVGVQTALERYGLFEVLRASGYGNLEIATFANDERHSLIVTGEATGRGREHLVELVVRRDRLLPDGKLTPPLDVHYDVLTIDWLTLRHPAGCFSRERPRLPGQDAPGLGQSVLAAAMLEQVGLRLGLQAVVTTGEYFHNAVFYHRGMQFFDPAHRGLYEALRALLLDEAGLSLAQASWAIAWGCVRLNHEPFDWRGELQVRPLDRGLEIYLDSRVHHDAARAARSTLRFDFDERAFAERWSRQEPVLVGAASGEDP